MKTMKKSVLGAAVAVALGFGSAAHAGVIIDLFDNAPIGGTQTVATSTLNATDTAQNPVAYNSSSVIGQYRDLSIKKTFDNVGDVDTGESTLYAGGGALQLDNATGNKSIGVVTWDGANVAGDLGTSVNPLGFGGVGINLTVGGAEAFLASVIAADLGFSYKITVWDMDGDSSILSAAVQGAVDPSDNATAGYLFSWFNLVSGTYCDGVVSPPLCGNPATQLDFSIVRSGGLIDFTRIGALQLELTNPSLISVDLAIGTIETVPEPGALALVGIALLGATVAGRQRKAPKA